MPEVRRPLERKLEGLDSILGREELGEWADNALIGFGDLHGTYRELAEGRRFRERKHAETHQRRRKGTRAHSARRHQGEKKRRDRKGESKLHRAKKRYDEQDWNW